MKYIVIAARLYIALATVLAIVSFVGMILYLCAWAFFWGEPGDSFYGFWLLVIFGLCAAWIIEDVARNREDKEPPESSGGAE